MNFNDTNINYPIKRNKRRIGAMYEDMTAQYLESQGLYILERNFRCHMGEIDLIALDGKYLVFVEVKFRKFACSGEAAEAVDYRKKKVICSVAKYYLMKCVRNMDVPCRFDVVAIDNGQITWYPNAFDAI